MSVSHAVLFPPAPGEAATPRGLESSPISGLMATLAQMSDPRDPRGVRHPLATVLGTAVIATLAGAKNYRELGDNAADMPSDLLWLLGARWSGARAMFLAPSGGTIRRVLIDIDAAELDLRIGAWLREHTTTDTDQWVIAIDGKVLRGSFDADGRLTLFSAMLHHEGTVIGQVRVPAGTNEITCVKPLLADMDITGALITADAAHTQTETARYITEDKGADYLLTVKGNQPNLMKAAVAACTRMVTSNPPDHVTEEHRGGRLNRWSTWVTDATTVEGIDFHAAQQLGCIRRDVLTLTGQMLRKEFAIVITSRTPDRLDTAGIHTHTRGHWGIENLEHRARDTIWDEDAHQAYIGNGPQAMATLRNLALSLLRRAGTTEITRTVQHIARDRMRALPLIAT